MYRKVDFIYFKENGKLYTEASAQIDDDTNLLDLEGEQDIAVMYVIVKKIREMNQEGKLPGLQSGKWNGFIYVTCSEGYPHLIVPR